MYEAYRVAVHPYVNRLSDFVFPSLIWGDVEGNGVSCRVRKRLPQHTASNPISQIEDERRSGDIPNLDDDRLPIPPLWLGVRIRCSDNLCIRAHDKHTGR
jgi:hypothetical protein